MPMLLKNVVMPASSSASAAMLGSPVESKRRLPVSASLVHSPFWGARRNLPVREKRGSKGSAHR
eukprot:scaffold110413_cov28-Tisochrysis_lutea.AAC.1